MLYPKPTKRKKEKEARKESAAEQGDSDLLSLCQKWG